MPPSAKTPLAVRELLALLALTLSAFLLNTSEFVPIGLLTDIAGAFGLTESGAGLMISLYAWAVALLSLPLMLAASRVAPRALILCVLAVFCSGQVGSALAPSFELLVASRLMLSSGPLPRRSRCASWRPSAPRSPCRSSSREPPLP